MCVKLAGLNNRIADIDTDLIATRTTCRDMDGPGKAGVVLILGLGNFRPIDGDPHAFLPIHRSFNFVEFNPRLARRRRPMHLAASAFAV
jgi:hypothetical protein